jgi:transposase
VVVDADEIMPKQAKQAITGLHDYCNNLSEGIETFEAEIVAHARRDETARRLATIPGIALCANDNETKYPVKFRLRAT